MSGTRFITQYRKPSWTQGCGAWITRRSEKLGEDYAPSWVAGYGIAARKGRKSNRRDWFRLRSQFNRFMIAYRVWPN